MGYLRRTAGADIEANGGGVTIFDPEELTRWPALLEWLTCPTWPDEVPRDTGSLLLFQETGRLKVCLNDRDQGRVCFVVADGLLRGLDAAEAILKGASADWRPQRKERPPRAGK